LELGLFFAVLDDATRPMFGPLRTGRIVTVDNRAETIGGTYRLGTGFMGLGVVLLSQQNFARMFPLRGLGFVNLAPVVLKAGVGPDQAASALRRILPCDIRVFTRKQLDEHETAYWTTRTAVGLIFGSGLVIAIVVGITIVYQTLATQISRHLLQLATLEAIGYSDESLYATVAAMAVTITAVGFVPAFLAALWLYSVIRQETDQLPQYATPAAEESRGSLQRCAKRSARAAACRRRRCRRCPTDRAAKRIYPCWISPARSARCAKSMPTRISQSG
jgi:putative ABC transport system permease protein